MQNAKKMGRILSREEMKKIKGGTEDELEGTIHWRCSCHTSGSWLSACENTTCLELQANSNCGYGVSYTCSAM